MFSLFLWSTTSDQASRQFVVCRKTKMNRLNDFHCLFKKTIVLFPYVVVSDNFFFFSLNNELFGGKLARKINKDCCCTANHTNERFLLVIPPLEQVTEGRKFFLECAPHRVILLKEHYYCTCLFVRIEYVVHL